MSAKVIIENLYSEQTYEEFRNSGLLERYKINELKIKDKWTYQGNFTIDNKINVKFVYNWLERCFFITVPEVIKNNTELLEIYKLARKDVQEQLVHEHNVTQKLLKLEEKIDNNTTFYLNPFININEQFKSKKRANHDESFIEHKIFYTHEDGYEEDVTEAFSVGWIDTDEVKSIREFLEMHLFYVKCRTLSVTSEQRFKCNGETLEHFKETIKQEYNRFQFEIYIHRLNFNKN